MTDWLHMRDKSYNLEFVKVIERTKSGIRLHFVDKGKVEYDLPSDVADAIYHGAPDGKRAEPKAKAEEA